MSDAFLQLIGVEKRYNPGTAKEVRAVRDFNLAANKSEILALLGSSGCGKTSTLRMVAGFEEVSAGKIIINGREVQTLPPSQRGVAMAFEGYSLYPPLSVGENIAFGLKGEKLARDEIDRRVKEIAHLLEIEEILGRYPGALSGGQQQRASLGRALVRSADLHLLDEPMGQLEPQLRALLRGRIKHFIKERGLTAILVTHDQTEANALADRIVVMEGGELQQFDTPQALKDHPANLFTGAFIGEPPMNLFPARAASHDDRLVFDLGANVQLHYGLDDFAADLRDILEKTPQIVLGVRPHAVRTGENGTYQATVTANQWLGDQSHIAAQFAGGTLISVAHDRVGYAPGDTIGVEIAARDLHIFDADSGRAVGAGRQA